jgi:hypothetical protein
MPSKRIDGLPELTTADPDAYLIVVSGGVSKKLSLNTVLSPITITFDTNGASISTITDSIATLQSSIDAVTVTPSDIITIMQPYLDSLTAADVGAATPVSVAAAESSAAAAAALADSKINSYYQSNAPTGLTATDVGDLWVDTDDGNKLYRWDTDSWEIVQDSGISTAIVNAATAQATADGKVVTYYQATAPTPEGIGDIWIDSDDDKTYRWNGTTWENFRDPDISTAVANAANAQASADGKINSYYGPTAPTGLVAADIGDIWVNTVEYNNQYRWNGSSWIDIQDGGISTAITNAAGAQGTADGKVRTFYQTEAPTGMVPSDIGDLWVDINDRNKLYRYSGVVWMSVQDTTVADNIYTANTTTIEGGRITANSITAALIRVSGEGAFLPAHMGAATQSALDITNATVTAVQSTADGKIESFYQASVPTASGIGDFWTDTDDGNKLYRWDGTGWVEIQDSAIQTAITNAAAAQGTADGKVTTFYQASAPTAEGVGDLWVDTDAGNRLYRWGGSSWINVQDGSITTAITNAATAQLAADGKIRSFYQTSAPTGLSTIDVGDIWIDTDDSNNQHRWSGAAWVDIQDGGIASAISAAAGAQSTADGKVQTFYQNNAPTAEGTGDLWIDTNDGNKLYRWSGSSWVTIQDSTIAIAQATAEGRVLPAGVADAINNNTTTINGAKITTGSLAALSADLGTVTAGKMESPDGKFIIDLSNKYISITV